MLKIITSKFSIKYLYCRYLSKKPNFGFVFDIDGVIVRGKNVLPDVPKSFERLIGSNDEFRVPTIFVTNSGNTLRQEKAADLTKWLGIKINEDQVVLSHTPLHTFKEFQDKKVLLSGQGNIMEIALEIGFMNFITMEQLVTNFPSLDYVDKNTRRPVNGPIEKNFEKIDGIILLNEPINWETSLQLLVDLLITDGMPSKSPTVTPYPHIFVIACNMDLLWPSKAPLARYGHGAFLLCLENLYEKITGNALVYTAMIGKPSILTYRYAHDQIIHHAKSIGIDHKINRIYAIGDNINTDVLGANLYHEYLKTRPCSTVGEYVGSESIPLPKFHDSLASECLSILVESGVHHVDSKFYLGHSHRNFMSVEDSLFTPVIRTPDVNSAINIVLEKENFE